MCALQTCCSVPLLRSQSSCRLSRRWPPMARAACCRWVSSRAAPCSRCHSVSPATHQLEIHGAVFKGSESGSLLSRCLFSCYDDGQSPLTCANRRCLLRQTVACLGQCRRRSPGSSASSSPAASTVRFPPCWALDQIMMVTMCTCMSDESSFADKPLL